MCKIAYKRYILLIYLYDIIYKSKGSSTLQRSASTPGTFWGPVTKEDSAHSSHILWNGYRRESRHMHHSLELPPETVLEKLAPRLFNNGAGEMC